MLPGHGAPAGAGSVPAVTGDPPTSLQNGTNGRVWPKRPPSRRTWLSKALIVVLTLTPFAVGGVVVGVIGLEPAGIAMIYEDAQVIALTVPAWPETST